MFTNPNIKLLDKYNVNCDQYISDPNKFHSLSVGNSNKCQSSDAYLYIEGKVNLFSHFDKEKATDLLSAICNCIQFLGFEKEVTRCYKEK